MITFITFINFIILFIIALSYLLVLYNAWRFIIKKSLDTFQYKIYNFFICWIISLTYISYFIIFLYYLRIYTFGHTLDLKPYYYTVKKIFLSTDSLIISYFVLFIMLILGICILMTMEAHKIGIKNILRLFLYYFPDHKFHKKNKTPFENKIGLWFLEIGGFLDQDLFTYYLHQYLSHLFRSIGTTKLYLYSKNIKSYEEAEDKYLKSVVNSSKYHPLNIIAHIRFKRFYWFITLSPFLLLILECIFNNFVIYYTFYYLLVYTPLMVIRTITNFVCHYNRYFCYNLWRIYYYNVPFIYALPVRTPTVKHLWELHLMNNLKVLSLYITDQFSPSKNPSFCMDFQDELLGQMAFFQDRNNSEAIEKNLYTNGVITAQMVGGILYEYTEKYDYSECNINFKTGEVIGELIPPKIVPHLGDPWIILHNNVKEYYQSKEYNKSLKNTIN